MTLKQIIIVKQLLPTSIALKQQTIFVFSVCHSRQRYWERPVLVDREKECSAAPDASLHPGVARHQGSDRHSLSCALRHRQSGK
jgi:hypothetical protein